MKALCGTILAAVTAFKVVYAIDCADVSVADFPRLAGESGDSSRIMRAIEKAGGGGVVWFPRGEYEIDSMIVVSNQSSLLMHKSAHLKAVREMPFVLKYFGRLMERHKDNSPRIIDHNLFIKGGDIEKAAIAQYSVDIGTRPDDGAVVALGYQATGGAFIYRRSIAKDVFGSDDPAVVAEALGAGTGNWDKFYEAAATLKAKGYGIISGDGDLWHAVENSSETGWIVDGKLNIDPASLSESNGTE